MGGFKIGERIREIRNSKGITQEALSHDAKIAHSTLQRIESGKQDPAVGTILGKYPLVTS